jgi:hypothetical protein
MFIDESIETLERMNSTRHKIMSTEIILDYEEAMQLFSEIENEGFGYWVQNYGYKGKDKELVRLCKEAETALNNLESYIENIYEHHDIG